MYQFCINHFISTEIFGTDCVFYSPLNFLFQIFSVSINIQKVKLEMLAETWRYSWNLPLLSSECNQTKTDPFTLSRKTVVSNSMTFLSTALEMWHVVRRDDVGTCCFADIHRKPDKYSHSCHVCNFNEIFHAYFSGTDMKFLCSILA